MSDHSDQVRRCLREFLDSTGHRDLAFSDDSNLIRDLGLKSDEGVDFVLDLCDTFNFNFPEDFNPFVHKSGRRGRKVKELIAAVKEYLGASEAE